MGNVLANCMLQPSGTVRVIKSDEGLIEFDQPVKAKQLMRAYPEHLVMHCTAVHSGKLGQRSKVSLMRAEDVLLNGQTYCLIRVPNQGGKVVVPKVPKQPNRRPQSGEIGKTRKQSLRGCFGANDLRISDSVLDELVLQQLQQHASSQHQQGPRGPWKPHLDVILESPSRSLHSSITMSPLARQAGYVPVSKTPMHVPPIVESN